MNTYMMTFVIAVCSMTFWAGAALMAMVLLGSNRLTFRFQVAEPVRFQIVEPEKPKRRRIKRLTGVLGDDIWETIAAYHASGWEYVLKEEHGVRIYTVILEKFE